MPGCSIPRAIALHPTGTIEVTSFWGLLLNPWALLQYAHNMIGAVQTGCFVMAAVGAFYLLAKRDEVYGRTFVRIGVIVGVLAAVLQLFPTGDLQGKMVAATSAGYARRDGRPVRNARKARRSRFWASPMSRNVGWTIPSSFRRCLSFLTYRHWERRGARSRRGSPKISGPTNILLLYYSYHIMVGLGTIFIAVMLVAAFLLLARQTLRLGWMLWILMLCLPLPYIANTAGWMTAEIGRQPWLIYGLMRTAEGASPRVVAGNGLFTLLGFMGMYTVLSILLLFLIYREIEHGPEPEANLPASATSTRGGGLRRNRWESSGSGWSHHDRRLRGARWLRPRRRRSPPAGRAHSPKSVVRSSLSIGPVWDGNEVWLLAGGGTLYFAFPALYASASAASICR